MKGRPYTDAVVHLFRVDPEEIECYVREFGPGDRCAPFKSFRVGPISFYVPFDKGGNDILRKVLDTLNEHLALTDCFTTEAATCPDTDPPSGTSTPCSGIAPICDGTSFPLLPTCDHEATSEPVATASSMPSPGVPGPKCSCRSAGSVPPRPVGSRSSGGSSDAIRNPYL